MPWVDIATKVTGNLVTAAEWVQIRTNFQFIEEVAYAQITADVSITATTDVTANQIVSSGAITYEAVPHLIEFFAPWAVPDSAAASRQLFFSLWDASTELGRIGQLRFPAASASAAPIKLERRLTPTAASHTYIVKAHVSAGTGTVAAGAGGATTVTNPGFIRITRIPT